MDCADYEKKAEELLGGEAYTKIKKDPNPQTQTRGWLTGDSLDSNGENLSLVLFEGFDDFPSSPNRSRASQHCQGVFQRDPAVCYRDVELTIDGKLNEELQGRSSGAEA
ncbi:hypothetical protein MRX96_020605 [Rhipicephalus microplus]